MSALLPSLLPMVAALAAAVAVLLLSLSARGLYARLWQRHLARLGAAQPREAREPGLLGLLRATVLPLIAVESERWLPERWKALLEKWLERAGRPRELTAPEMFALSELGFASFALMGVLLWASLDAWQFLVAGPAFGAALPVIWLRDRVRERMHLVTRALPYSLDLLTLSVEAGLDFAAALGKVVEKGRAGPLRDELSLTLRELKLGKTREEAMRNLAARIDLPSLTSFVSSLLQADRMGTPLGKILRILATQMRVERTHRAEKLANEAPVKLLLPLVGCIFPTLFLMLFGPIVYSVFLGGGF